MLCESKEHLCSIKLMMRECMGAEYQCRKNKPFRSRTTVHFGGEGRAKDVQSIKRKSQDLERHSKQWWRINRGLLRKRASMPSVSSLRDEFGWRQMQNKISFVCTISDENKLLVEVVDTPFCCPPEKQLNQMVVFRSLVCEELLSKSDESKATANDNISAVILKEVAVCIASPFTIICRRLYFEVCWPSIWKFHSTTHIFKKGAVCNPGNYCGVYLTIISSEIPEKLHWCSTFLFSSEERIWRSKSIWHWLWGWRSRHNAGDVVDTSHVHWKENWGIF